MVHITKIKCQDLLEFVSSAVYLQFKNKPISVLRAHAYIHNVHGNKEDVVLYMAFIKNELVGYRTIFKDVFYYKNTLQNFGWLSGNWVHPNYRRKNISTMLFNEVLKDWGNRLMYSNYAEASKAVYDKTAFFDTLKSLHGIRYYRRVCFAEVLPPKGGFFKRMKPVWRFIDWSFNLFLDVRFSKAKYAIENAQKITDWNEDIQMFISLLKKEELFKRTKKTYQWIASYPWIKTDITTKENSKAYYFSSYAKSFHNDFYVIKNAKKNKIEAVINISIRNQQMKVPYLYSLDIGIDAAKKLLLHLAKIHKVKHITIYDKRLNNSMKDVFIIQKQFVQTYFVTKGITQKFPQISSYEIQTGDGDGVFT